MQEYSGPRISCFNQNNAALLFDQSFSIKRLNRTGMEYSSATRAALVRSSAAFLTVSLDAGADLVLARKLAVQSTSTRSTARHTPQSD